MFKSLLNLERILFCPLCGEGPLIGKHRICDHCLTLIRIHLLDPRWSLEAGFPVFSLLNWTGKSSLAEALAYTFKETKDPRFFNAFASLMVSSLSPSLFHGALLLPIPSSTHRKHSDFLSETVSSFTGAVYKTGHFQLLTNDRQPGLSKKERMRRHIFLTKTEDLNLPSYNVVWIVDDIMTTGASMRAAQKALKAVKPTFGLTLFKRGLSIKLASC